uniref:Secreted protein n=1 Tax=Ascaris lumbricoides TaxID=6252 RepID=A0A0M3HQK7_ASCLU
MLRYAAVFVIILLVEQITSAHGCHHHHSMDSHEMMTNNSTEMDHDHENMMGKSMGETESSNRRMDRSQRTLRMMQQQI